MSDYDDLMRIIVSYRKGYAFHGIVEEISASWDDDKRYCKEAPKHFPMKDRPYPPEEVEAMNRLRAFLRRD